MYLSENIRFSLICPTRKRKDKLFNLIKSIEDTVYDKTAVELIIIYDSNDPETESAIQSIKSSINIIVLKREQSVWLNHDYYNYACQYANGEYLWCIGDDVLFLTQDWDKIVYEKAEEYFKDKKRIALIKTDNSTPLPTSFQDPVPFCCFPIFTKQAYKVLGFIMPPRIATWGADIMIYRLYLAVNRILDLSASVKLDHIAFHNNKIPPDEVSQSMRKRASEYGKNRIEHEKNDLPQYIKILKRAI